MVNHYTPPSVWRMELDDKKPSLSANRPDSGARYKQDLPVGKHSLQLYSMGTPNGQKVTIMLEELLALGIKEAEYDANLIKIGSGDQFSSGFVTINPNSKIPALVDYSSSQPINIFESGNILFYLAERFGVLLPQRGAQRVAVMNWLFWLQGSAPYIGGGFGHFYLFAPEKYEYPINRFAMESKRQLDVLDKQLAKHTFIAGDEYSIADIAIWPWFGNLVLGNLYNAAEFLNVKSYPNVQRWAHMIARRTAVQRGRIVNRIIGEEWERVSERHSATDIDEALASRSE
ncbi:glutathione-dependent disulfide-bond oxidoreductase [Pokkaliibacter plantistimulans]|uniref:Glutathione-dependent disulfide-bond oxidoreductase n=1 Tax=Proteobacteria bacterium 228 TaxID=2083153 RepID=A0A2S5KS90_9PROT|nr:glutathione-dependent disulfide-bond oxidoreductase [Pokkaliibacter plantistimulans]PPC77600.1 glutathione-dependent disulfide-bond oxidoreductase [Pokkaliibacter plantistimulans]